MRVRQELTKRCPVCESTLPLEAFHINRTRGDGRYYCCRSCRSDLHREVSPDQKARRAWINLNLRAGNKDGKHPTYIDVEVHMTWEEFHSWYVEGYFSGATVDRIDNDRHYELSNIQLLSKSENSKKSSLHKNFFAPEGTRWCVSCAGYLPISEFYRNAVTHMVSKCAACYRSYQNERNRAKRAGHE